MSVSTDTNYTLCVKNIESGEVKMYDYHMPLGYTFMREVRRMRENYEHNNNNIKVSMISARGRVVNIK